jgi:hypothetical protein
MLFPNSECLAVGGSLHPSMLLIWLRQQWLPLSKWYSGIQISCIFSLSVPCCRLVMATIWSQMIRTKIYGLATSDSVSIKQLAVVILYMPVARRGKTWSISLTWHFKTTASLRPLLPSATASRLCKVLTQRNLFYSKQNMTIHKTEAVGSYLLLPYDRAA